MTLSTIDLTQRLDQIESRLPPLSAKSFALGRATVRRGNDVVVSVVSDVARRVDTVVATARTGAKTTTGQAKSSASRTAKVAESTAKQTAGQAKSAVSRTAKVAESTAKQTTGQAKRQARATADAAHDAANELVDDATISVDPDAHPRGVAYEEWTKSDLYDRAQELDLEGRSTMSKPELISALRSA